MIAALAVAAPAADPRCAVTKPTLPAGRYGARTLSARLPDRGRVTRGPDGTLGDKPGCWRLTGRAGTATVSYVVTVVAS